MTFNITICFTVVILFEMIRSTDWVLKLQDLSLILGSKLRFSPVSRLDQQIWLVSGLFFFLFFVCDDFVLSTVGFSPITCFLRLL